MRPQDVSERLEQHERRYTLVYELLAVAVDAAVVQLGLPGRELPGRTIRRDHPRGRRIGLGQHRAPGEETRLSA